MQFSRTFVLASTFLVLNIQAFCQTPAVPAQNLSTSQTGNSGLVLGPGDQLTVAAPDIPELDRRVLRIQADGSVSVPLVGSLKAAGMTADEFREKLDQALSTQFRNPHIGFTQIDVKSKPVSVLGAVNNPGIVQADGRRHLIEIISLAGGLKPDAGTTVTVSRKNTSGVQFPANLRPTLAGNYLVATISLSALMEGADPSANVLVYPGDVVTVPKGKLVYALGDVNRSGGFVIGESNTLTVLKVLSLAEGLRPTADESHARILRTDATGKRTEEQLNLKKLLAGKAEDVTLNANDILYVPGSLGKKVAERTIRAGVDTGTGVAIYRH